MLIYEDDDQTLRNFYSVQNLDVFPEYSNRPDETSSNPTPENPFEFADPQQLENLSTIEQYELLNNYLTKSSALHTFKRSENDSRDLLTGQNLTRQLMDSGVVSSATDPNLNQYLVSSQLFNPQAYLLTVHRDTPIEKLLSSLDHLDKSIRSQTSQLKSVLSEDFDLFVGCKKSIDSILAEFKSMKSSAQQEREKSKVFNPAISIDKKKVQVGESLLLELGESINNLNMTFSLMIKPLMEHKGKEAKVSALIEFVQSQKFIFDLPSKLVTYISTNDHDSFIDDYNRFLREKRSIEEQQRKALAKAGDEKSSRKLEQLHQLQNSALSRVYKEVTTIANEYRKKTFDDLLSMDHEVNVNSSRKLTSDVKFIDLVDKLHKIKNELSSSNPIHDFLTAQLEKLDTELKNQTNKFEAKFLVMQKKLLNYISSLPEQRENLSHVKYIADKFESIEQFFRASSTSTPDIDREKEGTIVEMFGNSENLDLSIINETWLVLANFIRYIEEFFSGALLKFVKNYVHYSNPRNGYNVDQDGRLRELFFTFLNDVILSLMKIFSANTRSDQLKVSPSDYTAFIPHHTNSLSAMFYLGAISRSIGAILTNAGVYSMRVGNVSNSFDTNKQISKLRDVSNLFDQRILEAICATWVNDCSQFYDIENWEKYESFGGSKKTKTSVYTKLMQVVYYYELAVLETLGCLLKRTEDSSEDLRIVSSYPSKRILVSLEIQFMRSMNVLVDSAIKKFTAEKAMNDDVSVKKYQTERCIYKILTMNNFTALGSFVFPRLIKKFDHLFDKTLQDRNLKLFADLDKISITILEDINEVEKGWIEAKIEENFTRLETNIPKGKSAEIDPFVYDCLLHFVTLVHVLRPITNGETFATIMQQLQTQFLLKFLLCVRATSEREAVIAAILGNIKLDLDFFVEVFEKSETIKLDDYCINLVQIILGQIDKVEGMFLDLNYSQEEISDKLKEALRHSLTEFSCFL